MFVDFEQDICASFPNKNMELYNIRWNKYCRGKQFCIMTLLVWSFLHFYWNVSPILPYHSRYTISLMELSGSAARRTLMPVLWASRHGWAVISMVLGRFFLWAEGNASSSGHPYTNSVYRNTASFHDIPFILNRLYSSKINVDFFHYWPERKRTLSWQASLSH